MLNVLAEIDKAGDAATDAWAKDPNGPIAKLIVPVVANLSNLWLTARGRVGALWRDVGGRFVLAGSVWYLVACLQGSFQSLPSSSETASISESIIASRCAYA